MPVIYHNLTLRPGKKEAELLRLCERKLHAPVRYFRILKKSLDARDKSNIKWCVFGGVLLPPRTASPRAPTPASRAPRPKCSSRERAPRGSSAPCASSVTAWSPSFSNAASPSKSAPRTSQTSFKRACLLPTATCSSAKGVAGTFSDGKLYTQTNSAFHREILETFVEFGAPEEIAYLGRPHIGSDKLRLVIANMRRYILEHGGTIRL